VQRDLQRPQQRESPFRIQLLPIRFFQRGDDPTTDRRIGFWEAANQPRSIDYPFTVIEMRLNRDGEGEGKMSIATKITLDKDKKMLELENYGTQPVLLQNVKRDGG